MSFQEKLSAILAKELAEARGDHERMAGILEAMARGLGLTLAASAHGNPSLIDVLATGAEAYMHEEAVEQAPLIRLLSGISR